MISVNGNNISLDSMGLFTSNGKWERVNVVDELCELIYVIDGELSVNDYNKFSLVKGNMIVLKPDKKPRKYQCTPKTLFYWVKFYVDIPENFLCKKVFFDTVRCNYLLKEMLHYSYIYKKDCTVAELILAQIIVQNKIAVPEKNTKKIIADVYEMIRLNSSAKLKVSDVADLYGYNKNHISRLIKREYGVGIKSLIDRFIIEKAKSYLVHGNLSIKEISVLLKFETENSFVKFYKYHENKTPTQYRNDFSITRVKEITLDKK